MELCARAVVNGDPSGQIQASISFIQISLAGGSASPGQFDSNSLMLLPYASRLYHGVILKIKIYKCFHNSSFLLTNFYRNFDNFFS